ncbi:GNAT family N-acetyltransferase [Sphaerisporangium perillae]|uniref:GNAT family N-acetyltransferase n=1 Tax=Sphaerisporangium perillae TaxID=2935860 RepID=UPI00200FEBB2|nr:GNAT family N-acetyltransferase [Sphaerisporangium perillae]
MSPDVRVLGHEDELLAAAAVFRAAMVGLPPFPAGADIAQLFEPGRTLGAFVDGELAGTADSYSSRLVVPGGARVPHAAVTHVGVLPTHTRRGVVTALLRRQLADIAERGEIVATLRASEAVIYERFGYGVAGSYAHRELSRRRAHLRDTVPHGGRVRLVDGSSSWKLLAQIYESGAVWTGAIDRPDYWWRQQEQRHNGDPGPAYVAVHGPAGAEDGYVRYHPINTAEWFTSQDRVIVVDDLVAATPEAYAGLIRYLLGVDLVDRIVFPFTAVDDPLAVLLTDDRAVRTSSIRDETWLRIIDVPAALARRGYRGSGSLVLAVTDRLLPGNTGTYLIGAQGATRIEAPADLAVDVATLGALYLGGSRWWQHARAGRVAVHRDGAVEIAEELFGTDALPFAGTVF